MSVSSNACHSSGKDVAFPEYQVCVRLMTPARMSRQLTEREPLFRRRSMAACSCSLVSSGLLARTSASTFCDSAWASGDAADSGAEPSCDAQQQSAQGTQSHLHAVHWRPYRLMCGSGLSSVRPL